MHLKVPNSLTPYQQIKRLGALLASAIGCGLLVIGFMLYTARPQTERRLKLADVLIAPDLLPQIALNEHTLTTQVGSSTSKPHVWHFDTIEMKYVDPVTHQWVRRTLTPDEYALLYAALKNDSSLTGQESEGVPAAIEGPSIELSVWLTLDDKYERSVLQTVLFFPNVGLYRVMLYKSVSKLKSSSERLWASFHHENLEILLDPFTQEGLN